jgi:phosphoribosylformylglycinamidine (FGAM) synthase-like enzyme
MSLILNQQSRKYNNDHKFHMAPRPVEYHMVVLTLERQPREMKLVMQLTMASEHKRQRKLGHMLQSVSRQQ